MLVELSVVEQRYHAVWKSSPGRRSPRSPAATESRARPCTCGWANITRTAEPHWRTTRTRPHFRPRQIHADVEALISQLRNAHPRWGPRRLEYELARAGVSAVPSRSTVYRVLVRHGLVAARKRKRRRQDYRRWQRCMPGVHYCDADLRDPR